MAYSRGECQLRSIRKAAGLRQIDVARRSGYTRQMIHKFENNIGSKMSPEAMYAISRAIGCQMEDLYPWIWVDDAES